MIMPDYKDDIITKARDLRAKHPKAHFRTGAVTGENLRKIAERFTGHRLTNVETIKSIKKAIQYMIAAKMVGDRKLYTKLNEYTGELLDDYCDGIQIEDDCNDGFNTAVERHLFRANEEVFELLKSNKIKYIDAGLVKYGGSDIFIPSYNALIHVIGNRRCVDEVNDLIKRTPEEDKHNDTDFSWEPKAVKSFIVLDGKLKVTVEDSDDVEVGDGMYVNEYIVDAETDPDKINMRMFDTSTSKKGTIRTFRRVPLNKLQNGDEVMINGGIVYYDEKNHKYRIIGNYSLMKFDRYEGLNQMYLIYSYPGLKDEQFVDTINLGNLNKHVSNQKLSDWSYEYGADQLNSDLLYLFRGRAKIGEMKYRETVTFEDIKEILDAFV